MSQEIKFLHYLSYSGKYLHDHRLSHLDNFRILEVVFRLRLQIGLWSYKPSKRIQKFKYYV